MRLVGPHSGGTGEWVGLWPYALSLLAPAPDFPYGILDDFWVQSQENYPEHRWCHAQIKQNSINKMGLIPPDSSTNLSHLPPAPSSVLASSPLKCKEACNLFLLSETAAD